MKRSSDIKWLTIASLLAFVLLAYMQWRLVTHAYLQERGKFRNEISSDLTNALSYTRSISEFSDILEIYSRLLKEELSGKTEVELEGLIKKMPIHFGQTDSMAMFMDREIQASFQDIDMDYVVLISDLGFYDGNQYRPVMTDMEEAKMGIIGDLADLNNTFSFSSFTSRDEELLIQFKVFIKIRNERLILLQNMWLTLGLSLLSILAMGLIFLYTLRTLTRHRRELAFQTDFINNITHEFKTPLTVLRVAGKNLMNPQLQQQVGGIEGTARLIDRQSQRLQALVDQVSEVNWEDDQPVLKKEEVQLGAFVREVVNDFRVGRPGDDLIIRMEIPEEGFPAHIDRFHLTTALNNLLENAIKYNSPPIKIEVKVWRNGARSLIEIQDNGLGMAAKETERIFDKFYRISSGNLHEVKGLGLGLFYAKKVIGAHGGRIWAESQPGVGSGFFIELGG